MTTEIRFACIATNGSDPVVWGLGRTEMDAYRRAAAEDDELGQDIIVPVTAEQVRTCGRMGESTAASLGITLTREQLAIVDAGTLRDCGPF